MDSSGVSVQKLMTLMSAKISAIAKKSSVNQIDGFLDVLLKSERIFVMGAGRSGLVAKSFAMRLMHTGFSAFVVGETITPPISDRDVLVAFSGSGSTKTIGDIADTAKSIGAKVALITANPDSRIGKISDCVVKIDTDKDLVLKDEHEYEVRQMLGNYRSFAPLGTLFETASLIFGDAVISTLMDMKKIEEGDLKKRHTNIE